MNSRNHVNNIRNVFEYNSPVGKFTIKFNKKLDRWELSIRNVVYGQYLDPVAAADDVYNQATNFDEWDLYDIDPILENIPPDLYSWEISNLTV